MTNYYVNCVMLTYVNALQPHPTNLRCISDILCKISVQMSIYCYCKKYRDGRGIVEAIIIFKY